MTPIYDPVTKSLLVCDGWGTAFAAIRLRRLDIFSGEELASARLGNSVRCVALSDEELYAVLDKRVIALQRISLDVRTKWTERVPYYSDYAVATGGGLALMNSRGPSIHFYPLDSGQRRRREVGSCDGMYLLPDGRVLVCSGHEGRLWSFCPVTGQAKLLAEPGSFKWAAFEPASQQIALLMSNRTFTTSGVSLLVLSPADGNSQTLVPRGQAIGLSWLGSDELCLWNDADLTVYELCRGDFKKVSAQVVPHGFAIAQIVPELRMMIAVDHSNEGRSELMAIALRSCVA